MSDDVVCPPCFRCGVSFSNAARDANQPLGGTEFVAYGHYGSGVWDPLGGTTEYLVINICDKCMKLAGTEGIVLRGAPARRVADTLRKWKPTC